MKNKRTALWLVLLIALFAFSTTACGGGKRLNSADELKAYLDSLPVNSPDKPIKVAMKANDAMLKDIAEVLMNTDKYVSLDLSGSPLTEIPDNAFFIIEGEGNSLTTDSCETLVGIIIPKGVTSIGNYAFSGCRSLTSVTIPDSVTAIKFCAFSYCTSLTNVTIPNSVTSIQSSAFIGCTSLTSVTIPNSVTGIGYRAFEGCTDLASVTFQGTIPADKFFNSPFRGDLLKKYLAEGIGTYTTTAPVEFNSIWTKQSDNNNSSSTRSNVGGGRSFNSADALKTYLDKQPVNSPDKPIKIAMKVNDMMIRDIVKAIRDAGKYVSLDLSGSPLTEIPGAAFENCKSLVGIIIPNSVTSIGNYAFLGCTSLTSVTFQGTTPVRGWQFPGDLGDKYFAGGAGTYTRPKDSNTWTKQ